MTLSAEGRTVTKRQIRDCFRQWFYTLPQVCAIESPWGFLCLASMIDYLSAAAFANIPKQRDRYVAFIERFYSRKYRDFQYVGGQRDLPLQMYYILRNGLVHSFSLFPDTAGKGNGGRARSIALVHRANASGRRHLSRFANETASDAALFVAEDFMADSIRAAYRMLREVKVGTPMWSGITTRFENHPPIQWRK